MSAVGSERQGGLVWSRAAVTDLKNAIISCAKEDWKYFGFLAREYFGQEMFVRTALSACHTGIGCRVWGKEGLPCLARFVFQLDSQRAHTRGPDK